MLFHTPFHHDEALIRHVEMLTKIDNNKTNMHIPNVHLMQSLVHNSHDNK